MESQIILLGSALAGVATGAAAWVVAAPSRTLTFARGTPWWQERLAALMARWQSGWSPETRRAVDVLQWSARYLQRMSLGVAGLSALLAESGLSGTPLPWIVQCALALAAGLLVSYGGLPWWLQRQARQYQAGVMVNYPLILVMLRFYLALDYTPLDALTVIVPMLGVRGRKELQRILADIRTGTDPAAALEASRRRIQRMQWSTLMDTLSQNWGRRLKADALRPLSTMLASYRDQAARRLTSRLDVVVTIVPILAIFGTMVAGLFIMVLGLIGGSGISL